MRRRARLNEPMRPRSAQSELSVAVQRSSGRTDMRPSAAASRSIVQALRDRSGAPLQRAPAPEADDLMSKPPPAAAEPIYSETDPATPSAASAEPAKSPAIAAPALATDQMSREDDVQTTAAAARGFVSRVSEVAPSPPVPDIDALRPVFTPAETTIDPATTFNDPSFCRLCRSNGSPATR